MKPLISVIIPAYNNASTIVAAVQSMQGQTYDNLEIIVVDDNSTDETAKLVEEISRNDERVKIIKSGFVDPNRYSQSLKRNINAGYSARNAGFAAATGELLTLQDADDASLINRIEFQYELLTKYGASHICLDWQRFNQTYLGKKFDVSTFEQDHGVKMIGPDELYKLSQKTKGLAAKISLAMNATAPFSIKRLPIVHKIFLGSLAPYPGTGNSPIFKREVIEKVRFRKLSDRVWPSFMGRGADRDFNFQVAETFKNSYVFLAPLYLWRQDKQNDTYDAHDLKKYIY